MTYDIVLFGATGFTGRLVAEHLCVCAEHETLKWAIAGRNKARLEEVVAKLGKDVPVIVADSFDEASLAELCKATRVVISTVGPYALFGSLLVAACVENQCHYVDITGETKWVRQVIDRHEAEAREKGVLLVSMCGFDSVPADLGVFWMRNKAGKPLLECNAYVSSNGSASGGTIASILNLMESSSMEELRRMGDPFFLNPNSFRPAVQENDKERRWLSWHPRHGWTAPFVMAAVNTRVVRRSQALFAETDSDKSVVYGECFSYNEAMCGGSYLMLALTTIAVAVFAILAMIRLTRENILKRFLPAPGQGPSKQKRDRSWFRYDFEARTEDSQIVTGSISGGDPGYTETSKFVAEAALCLAFDSIEPVQPGGCLTPAAALGRCYIERLRKQNIRFE